MKKNHFKILVSILQKNEKENFVKKFNVLSHWKSVSKFQYLISWAEKPFYIFIGFSVLSSKKIQHSISDSLSNAFRKLSSVLRNANIYFHPWFNSNLLLEHKSMGGRECYYDSRKVCYHTSIWTELNRRWSLKQRNLWKF